MNGILNGNDARHYVFHQGDQARVYFAVIFGQSLFTVEYVDNIEISVDRIIKKRLDENEVYFHKDINEFSFVLNQEDTTFLKPGIYHTLIRVKLRDFDGTGNPFIQTLDGPDFEIIEGYSKEII